LQDVSAFCKDLKPFLFYNGINKLVSYLKARVSFIGTGSPATVEKIKNIVILSWSMDKMFLFSIIKGLRQVQTDKLIELKLVTAPPLKKEGSWITAVRQFIRVAAIKIKTSSPLNLIKKL